jgi:hypothetical protein
MEPEEIVEEEKKEPSLADRLRSLFAEFDNAPTAADIEALKAKYGDVFLSALNDDEMFLFRAVTRKEHRAANTAIAEGKLQGDLFEEEIVKTCLLWRSSSEDLGNKAGTIPSLFEQIMQNSNFLAPQLLSNLVTKL